MPNRQADWSWATKRVRVPGSSTAHLACVAVSLKNLGASLLRDFAPEGRNTDFSLKDVLSGLQVPTVLMRKNLVAFFVTKFPNPSGPFRCATAGLLNIP